MKSDNIMADFNQASNTTESFMSELFTPNNDTNFEDFMIENTSTETERHLQMIYPFLAVTTISLATTSIILYVILTLWERYGMDPMKRGIINRVSNTSFFFSYIYQ